MTALLTNPASPVTGDIDASGCNIGVYYDTGVGTVSGAEIHGANYFGVLVNGATPTVSVSITGSSIHNIGETPLNGTQHGIGVYVRAFLPGSATVTISGDNIWNYQKGGIVANGPGTDVTIQDNTVTGLGPVPFIAQNGIQLGYGASGSVTGNAISGNYYTGSGYQSAGLLLFDVAANAVMTSNNLFSGDQRNLMLVTTQACPSMYGGVYGQWGICIP